MRRFNNTCIRISRNRSGGVDVHHVENRIYRKLGHTADENAKLKENVGLLQQLEEAKVSCRKQKKTSPENTAENRFRPPQRIEQKNQNQPSRVTSDGS